MNQADYKQFTVKFNKADVPQLYSDWEWLIKPEELNQPLLMSCFGDLFYQTPKGEVWYLDTFEGKVSHFADNQDAMETKLQTPENQNKYLLSEVVMLLNERDLVLKENELYVYVPHPTVLGRADNNTIQIMSMNVVISLVGQLLEQTRSHK